MYNIKYLLEQNNIELSKLIKKLEKNINLLPEGSLNIKKESDHARFYIFSTNPSAGKKEKHYLGQTKKDLIKDLAQKDYNEKLLYLAKKNFSNNLLLLRKIKTIDLSSIYNDLSSIRKNLITPYIVDDDEYARRWESVSYENGKFNETDPIFYNKRGERVRSKSEILISNFYYDNKIPYRYEYPIKLSSNNRDITVRPDFQILNKYRRSVIYHEHFGLIDKPEYMENMLFKLELYAQNGIHTGKNLILTFESSTHPLNMHYLSNICLPLLK